jgi:membrane-associated protein
MSHNIVDFLRQALVHYGYWAVAALLLLENAGVPLPGETVLLLASFLASTERDLQLGGIIAVGTVASAVGSGAGYAIGHYGGRPLLDRILRVFKIDDTAVTRGEKLFERYGAAAILFSRFVFGMRVIAGPIAGVLRMSWEKFAIFNLIGAAAWVAAISCVGYFFGGQRKLLMHFMKRFDLVLVVAVVVILGVWWWKSRATKEKSAE